MKMGTNIGQVMTLANSIIGVSVLAMPFCFKQCGILLSTLLLCLSGVLSRFACRFLLQAAIITRRRNYEFLAFHVFGSSGKLCVELSIIGFLLGTCIAFFVVLGDLGPAITSSMFGFQHTDTLRTTILICVALLVVLPLGLLRNVDSLSSICTATIAFYLCLVLKVVGEAAMPLMLGDWLSQLNFWRPEGILQCLPIFSMALFCQTQLFEIFDSVPNAALDKMDSVVRFSVNMCTALYISVGFFGYVAFSKENITGNILISLSESMSSEVIKLGFFLSVAASFPLVIFPCRASLYSLLYRNAQPPIHDIGTTHVPEGRFKLLTLGIVGLSLTVGLFLPNIEQVLGIVGSTIGVTICIIIPALLLINTARHPRDKFSAQMILWTGAVIMILGTYAHILNSDQASAGEVDINAAADSSLNRVADLLNERPVDSAMLDLPIKFQGQGLEILNERDMKALNNVEENIKAPSVEPISKEKHGLKLEKQSPKPVHTEDKRKEPPVPMDLSEKVAEPPVPLIENPNKANNVENMQKQPVPIQNEKLGEKRHEPPVPVEEYEKPKEVPIPIYVKQAEQQAEDVVLGGKKRDFEKLPAVPEKSSNLVSVEPMDSVVVAPESLAAGKVSSNTKKKNKINKEIVYKVEGPVPGGEQVNQDAIRHEEAESALEGKKIEAGSIVDTKKKSEEQDLLKKLKEHQEVQRDMLQEQQKILQELKKHELGHQASPTEENADKPLKMVDLNRLKRINIIPSKINRYTPDAVGNREFEDSKHIPSAANTHQNKTKIGKNSPLAGNAMHIKQQVQVNQGEGSPVEIEGNAAKSAVLKPIIMPLPLAYRASSSPPPPLPKQGAGRDILQSQQHLDREKRDADMNAEQGAGLGPLKEKNEHVPEDQLPEDKHEECTKKSNEYDRKHSSLSVSKSLKSGDAIGESAIKSPSFVRTLNRESQEVIHSELVKQDQASNNNGLAPVVAMELKTPSSISEPQLEINQNLHRHVDGIGSASNAVPPTKIVGSKPLDENLSHRLN